MKTSHPNEVTMEGISGLYSLSAACEKLGIRYDTGRQRLYRGVPHIVIAGRYLVSVNDLKLGGRKPRPAA